MKNFLYVSALAFAALLAVTGCRPTKKVQRVENAIAKKDTTARIVVKPEAVDSMSIVKGIIADLDKGLIDFNSFSAKVKVEYQDKDGGDQANAFIQMKKDSAIWISLTGPFNIEGVRLLVTRDSVKLMNKIKKTVQMSSIDYLKELTQTPFDFNTLQDVIIGNPVFIDGKLTSYRKKDNGLQVLIIGNLFKHLVTLDPAQSKILHSKLDDVDANRNRTCDITFGQYKNEGGVNFSTYRKISVAEHSKLDVTLDFKKYTFNEAVSFPFNVPKNFKRK
ncbi:DUF4292 domain-containing protein [Filimonas effusa]|uniref:DUF4292 domain-containing protein n=1 Tax=Filimonas effusa TaxID=2508721 RepID=A0A4Q1D1I7_9BACT|nr:DUF4292 domain-containing protein [Filimonas effusa]RXK81728.1 DUF4292 domain-containing protein [Filimonas effusa]